MKRSAGPIIASTLLAIVTMAAPSAARAQSTPAIGKTGASHRASSGSSAQGQRPLYTTADVRFMQGMIAHHAQAMAMTSLVAERTSNHDIQLVAQRIRVSQRDEIALMRNWLREHGEEVPDPDTVVHMHETGNDSAMHGMPGMPGHALMPGMLTDAQMLELDGSSGSEFDRFFLQFMIQHHGGALTMVRTLFGSQGAGQVPEIYRFASDVDTDQRMEIERMSAMLHELQPADSSRHSRDSPRHSLNSPRHSRDSPRHSRNSLRHSREGGNPWPGEVDPRSRGDDGILSSSPRFTPSSSPTFASSTRHSNPTRNEI